MKKPFLKGIFVLLGAYAIAAALIIANGLNDHIMAADMIIVPGNQVLANGQPSPRLQARLDKAVQLYRQGISKRVFVSGGTGKEGWDESIVMANYLQSQQIPASAIIADGLGIDTLSTARNASAYMKNNQLVSAMVVTQYFHIPRTVRALKNHGISVVGSSHAEYAEVRDIYPVAREVPAYLSYLIR